MIEIKNLSKEYHITKKEEGIKGALKSLVKHDTIVVPAVKNLNFDIDKGEIVGFIGDRKSVV